MRDRSYRHQANKLKRTAKAASIILLAILLIVSVVPDHAYAAYNEWFSLDEAIAAGLYSDSEELEEEAAAEDRSDGEMSSVSELPFPKAKAANYIEALAQEYYPEEGTYELNSGSRFYITGDGMPSEELLETVRLMDSQFAAYGLPTEEPLEIVCGEESNAREGDIIIELKSEEDFLGINDVDESQAYKLDVWDTARVSACGTDGIYYGLISLMEIAYEKKNIAAAADAGGEAGDASAIQINCFRISDAPDLKERTIFIDCGRKYFSKKWLENFIRRSSLQRYNTIVLHFSEAEGLRLDSRIFPWLTKGIKSLTTDEMAEIVKLAQQYHMNVIPSIDVPGHNRYIVTKYQSYVKKHPDFSYTYKGKTYDKSIKGFGSIANHYSRDGVTRKVTDIGIDITKQHARAFSNALIDDYAEFFKELGCTDFDICGDEIMGWSNFMLGDNEVSYENRWKFLEHWKDFARTKLGIRKGSASDAFINYLNKTCERLEKMGYTCRVFNDEIDINSNQHLELNKSIGITCWDLANNSAKHFAKKGHVVYNAVMQWSYYVVRKINGKDIMKGRYKTVNSRNIFENWDPRSFSPKAGKKKYVKASKMGGGYFFIWCDAPDYKSAKTIWNETSLRTWANASRMWNPEVNSKKSGIGKAIEYKSMKKFANKMAGFPGYTGNPNKKTELPLSQSLQIIDLQWWDEALE